MLKSRLSLSLPITFRQRLHLLHTASGFVFTGKGHPLHGIWSRNRMKTYRDVMPYLLAWALTGPEDRLHRWAELDKPKSNPRRDVTHFLLPVALTEEVAKRSRRMAADYKNNSHRAFPWYVFSRMLLHYMNDKLTPLDAGHVLDPSAVHGNPVDEFSFMGLPVIEWSIDGGLRGKQTAQWSTCLEMAHRRNLIIASHPACPKNLRDKFRLHAKAQGRRITSDEYKTELEARRLADSRPSSNHTPIETRANAKGYWSAPPTEEEIRARVGESGVNLWIDNRGVYGLRCVCPVPTEDVVKKKRAPEATIPPTETIDKILKEYSTDATT